MTGPERPDGPDAGDELTPAELQRDESTLARRVVRPERVWIGVGTALVGMGVAGIALVSPLEWLAFVGALMVVAGVGFAWWNGVLADAHGGGMSQAVAAEEDEEQDGDAHAGTLPGDRLHDERAVSEAARSEAAAASVQASEQHHPPPSPFEQGRAAAAILALSALWLMITLPTFDLEPANRDAALRQGAIAIVLAVAAVRMVVAGPTLRWASTAAVAAALLLLSLALWWPELNGPRVSGIIGGGVGLVSALAIVAALAPTRRSS
jgi:hypothetical protein